MTGTLSTSRRLLNSYTLAGLVNEGLIFHCHSRPLQRTALIFTLELFWFMLTPRVYYFAGRLTKEDMVKDHISRLKVRALYKPEAEIASGY